MAKGSPTERGGGSMHREASHSATNDQGENNFRMHRGLAWHLHIFCILILGHRGRGDGRGLCRSVGNGQVLSSIRYDNFMATS